MKKGIEKFHSEGKEAHVLDIGTGTGLLSMLAVRYGADSVVACEAFLPMANCAVEIISENGFSEKIKVIRSHSTSLKIGEKEVLKQKANILVSEVFDTELIGEGALGTFNHALQNLLQVNKNICYKKRHTHFYLFLLLKCLSNNSIRSLRKVIYKNS